LPISTLRGQHIDNKEWLEDPAAPAIIVGTVDMIGSRMLFEGYGTSRKMRPYHAGLLGADALVVLDESHLVPPFERLLETIADGDREYGPREPLRDIIPPFRLTSLSATGRTRAANTFGLIETDFDDVVKQRLNARKQLTIKDLADGEKLPERIAKEAWAVSNAGAIAARVIVFCNSRKDAETARQEVEKLADAETKKGLLVERPETELFVGGRRMWEREAAADWLRSRGFLAGTNGTPSHAVFVFATSAGEVGVDLDADHMVCDLVAWERMVQRLGRVNRRGEGDARIIVVATPDPAPRKAVKEALAKSPSTRTDKEANAVAAHETEVEAARAKRRPLELLPRSDDGVFDASPEGIRKLKQSAEEPTAETDVSDAEERAGRRAILLAATTPAPLRPALTRALVDAWSMTSLKEHTGRPVVEPWLRGWVDDEPQTAIVWRKHLPVRRDGNKDGKDAVKVADVAAFFEAAPPHASELLETETYHVFDWLADRTSSLLKLAAKSVASEAVANEPPPLRRQDVVAILLDAAGDVVQTVQLDYLAFDSADKKENTRNREEVERRLKGATLVVDARLAGLGRKGLLDAASNEIPRTIDDGETWLPPMEGEEVVRFRVRLVESESASSRDWHSRFRLAMAESEDGEPTRWLAVAARLHDAGKKSQRWQRAFKAPSDECYAKTPGPVNVALLDGYRHELGSLPVAANDLELLKLPPELQALALHMIAAHHGFARPVIGISGCDDAPPSALEARACDVALRFARLQQRWGPWGLAWWESLLRAVDQAASRDNDAAKSQTTEVR
jgi:CRISPR-associated endonuclease/helicase Cas3